MTGPELKQMRENLGHAIGRRLSMADMARICGLAPKNGADTWRKWEEGQGPSGPVAAQLDLLKHACQGLALGPDMLRGAAMACLRHGIELRGGAPAADILREMLKEEIRRRLG